MCKMFVLYFLGCIIISLLPASAYVPQLIFPPTAPTRTQWIVGIGIPVQNLKFEAVTIGYVFKAEYFLPDNVTQLKTKTVNPFMPRQFDNQTLMENYLEQPDDVSFKSIGEFFKSNKKILTNSYRWTVYKGLEELANRMGLSGRDCVLKSICETAETPFHYYNGLFAELLHILLTPSSSVDKLSAKSDNEFYHAEHLGRSGANCKRVFNKCPRSLLDHFSDISNWSKDVMKIII